MDIQTIDTTNLRPSFSPPHPLFNSLIPLTIFDRAAFDLHVSIIYAFRPPMPTIEAMKEGLSKALYHFPHLAGRLTVDAHLRPCLLLNDAGIRIVEKRVSTALADHLPLDPSSDLMKLHPSFQGVEELLQIQFNQFSCGGIVIGLTAHHRVADGQSMSHFFVSWARLVRGLDVEPLPYHDRFAISVPRNPPKCEFDHQSIEFRVHETPGPIASSIENIVVRFSADFITKLKQQVLDTNPTARKFSTFECLLAHLWKKITLARGVQGDEITEVRVAVNGRARLRPAVPMEYFGNLVLWAYPKLRVDDLLKKSRTLVAKAIRDSVASVDDSYFKSFIDFGEILKGEEGKEMMGAAPGIGNSLCPDLEVDSWLRFQFHDLDFGGGPPCAFLPSNLPVEGLLVFVPSCEEKGGVDAFMALLPEHVNLFKQICHSLD